MQGGGSLWDIFREVVSLHVRELGNSSIFCGCGFSKLISGYYSWLPVMGALMDI